uniref:STAS domain-containing protein n=1 Tax=Streptomyces sp. CA-141956 TaxID=3240051 RepID=UPI003F49412A
MSAHLLVSGDSHQAFASVTGELDISTAPRIRQALLDTIHQRDQVIIDLDRLDFCDCAGLPSAGERCRTALWGSPSTDLWCRRRHRPAAAGAQEPLALPARLSRR